MKTQPELPHWAKRMWTSALCIVGVLGSSVPVIKIFMLKAVHCSWWENVWSWLDCDQREQKRNHRAVSLEALTAAGTWSAFVLSGAFSYRVHEVPCYQHLPPVTKSTKALWLADGWRIRPACWSSVCRYPCWMLDRENTKKWEFYVKFLTETTMWPVFHVYIHNVFFSRCTHAVFFMFLCFL